MELPITFGRADRINRDNVTKGNVGAVDGLGLRAKRAGITDKENKYWSVFCFIDRDIRYSRFDPSASHDTAGG